MSLEEQEATRQLFLRLVTITEQETWSRRRVPASEIVAIDVDVVTMESVIDQLGRQRFLAFDRDHASGAPTVEVAHEALLTEWERLRGWIEEGRADIARRAALDAAMTEWSRSGRDSDYLLTGKRLAEYESWRDFSAMRLTTAEHEYLNASIEQRDASVAAESVRVARETGLARSARRGWVALVGVLAALGIIGAAIVVLGDAVNDQRIALLITGDGTHIEELMVEGFDRAAHDFDFEPVVLQPPFTDLDAQVATLAESRPDFVLFWQDAFYKSYVENSEKYPDTTWAYLGEGGAVPMAAHEAAFLAGAAAALTTKTGIVGYVGGFQYGDTEKFRAGYEAGVHEIDPTIEILPEYTSLDTTIGVRRPGSRARCGDSHVRARRRCRDAGRRSGWHGSVRRGRGAVRRPRRHLWAIGADSDQFYDVPEAQQSHVLTSVIKRIDDGVYGLIRDYLDGGLESVPRELTLADGAVNYSTTGDNLSAETIAKLEALRAEIVSGKRSVPRTPSGPLPPPSSVTVTQNATVTFDGTDCRYDGPTNLDSGDVLHVRFTNASDISARFAVWTQDTLNVIEVPADPGTTNEGYGRFPAGDQQAWCLAEPGAVRAPGPVFEVT